MFSSVSSRLSMIQRLAIATLLMEISGWCQGYYRPVAPQPQSKPPCGHYGTPPCESTQHPAAVTIPPGATADQVYDLGAQAFARREYPIASGYFERAAEMGSVRAQASLGFNYMKGKGEPKDQQKAVYWVSKAAEKGHRVAQCQLGQFYEEGDGLPPDMKKAMYYYQLSANQHWFQCERTIGVYYELGLGGLTRSRATAIVWLTRAMEDGKDGFSQDLVTMLKRSDTPRFANSDEMGARLGVLLGDALPKWTGGAGPRSKPCRSGGTSRATDGNGNCPAGFDRGNGFEH